MATTTAKMALRKPAATDTVSVTTDISDNAQKLDDTLPTTNCTSSTKPGTPFTGQLIFETDTKVYRIWDAAAWRKVLLGDVTTDADSNMPASPTSFRNVIRNGGMDIWQRGAGPFTTAGYTADGWTTNPGSGATCQVDRLAIANGALAGRTKYGLQWARSVAGTTASLVTQPIEDVSSLAGKTVTISFEAWTASGSVDLIVRLDQYFGTGGSPSSIVTGTSSGVLTATTSTVGVRQSFTVAVASISGKTIGTAGNDYLQLIFSRAHNATNGATGTVYLRNVQVEEGATATPFEVLPYSEILDHCYRFFQRQNFTNGSWIGHYAQCTVTTTVGVAVFKPLVPLRATISTLSASGTFTLYTGVAVTFGSINSSTTNLVGVVNISHVALTAGGTYQFIGGTSSYIDIGAEL